MVLEKGGYALPDKAYQDWQAQKCMAFLANLTSTWPPEPSHLTRAA